MAIMNTGNLDILSTLLTHSPMRGEAGEVLTEAGEEWKETERMWLGLVEPKGRALPNANREASEIETVFEGWFRSAVKPQTRLVADGITYTVERVDPKHGRQWMYVYAKVVK